jgi:hypothetical protein
MSQVTTANSSETDPLPKVSPVATSGAARGLVLSLVSPIRCATGVRGRSTYVQSEVIHALRLSVALP